MSSLTIERNGRFSLTAFGDNHCGTLKRMDIIYKMTCLCAPKLDFRGFLFDQVQVDRYFQSIDETDLSCELLAMQSLKDLLQRIRKENPKCLVRKATLQLSPEPFMASITYTMELRPKAKRK